MTYLTHYTSQVSGGSSIMYITIYAIIILIPLIAGISIAIWGIRKKKKTGK